MIQKILNKKVLAAAVALTAASGFFFSQNNALSPVPAVHAQSSVQQLPDFTKLVEENGKAVVSIDVTKTMSKRPHPPVFSL